jgi:hypothetical protein
LVVPAAAARTAAPGNDLFANAQALSGGSGTVSGSNVDATKESGEPALAGNSGGASVWYSFTAPASGAVSVKTAGSSFDTLLGVYTGSSVSALSLVASNDDVSNNNRSSAVSFTASAGTTYRITVDGYRGPQSGQAAGSITLTWSGPGAPPPAGPANDLFANAQALSGASGSAGGSNVGATKESGEPALAGNSGGASVWFAWTAPSSGAASVSTSGSGFDTLLGVYTGSSVSALSLVASNDDTSDTDRTSIARFNAVAGTTYRITVDGYLGPNSGQAAGPIALSWTLETATPPPPPPPPASGPANDLFANAQQLSGTTGTASGSNVGATKETGEPDLAGNSGGASVWYAWTAPSSGPVSLDTAGSSFDTLLGVYTGSSVGALTLAGSNDDASGSVLTSALTFNAVGGTTYRIKVDGYRGPRSGQAAGSIALHWTLTAETPPPPPPAQSGDPIVLAAGDVGYCPNGPATSGAAQTAQQLAQFPSALVLLLGDGAYQSGTATEYATCYDPTWGQAKARTRPTPGYHDYETPNASGYFGYFGSLAGTAGRGYYSFDIGAWHVISLNAISCDLDCSSTSPQIQWLRADLAAHANTCTLAYFSYPLFTSGRTDGPTPSMKALWDVLYAGNADLILNGHEHNYERFAPQTPTGALDNARGIRQFVVGTGGRGNYPLGNGVKNSQVRYSATFGVLKLTLHPSSYDWQYLAASGSFTDAGSTACH